MHFSIFLRRASASAFFVLSPKFATMSSRYARSLWTTTRVAGGCPSSEIEWCFPEGVLKLIRRFHHCMTAPAAFWAAPATNLPAFFAMPTTQVATLSISGSTRAWMFLIASRIACVTLSSLMSLARNAMISFRPSARPFSSASAAAAMLPAAMSEIELRKLPIISMICFAFWMKKTMVS